jgi:hypothetical protein
MSGMAIQREDLPDLRPTERLSSLAATRVAWGLRGSVGPFVEIFDANEQLSTARVRISCRVWRDRQCGLVDSQYHRAGVADQYQTTHVDPGGRGLLSNFPIDSLDRTDGK